MPVITSTYNPPHFFRNGHFSTIYAALLRQVNGILQERERIFTPDDDFIDLDWSYAKAKTRKLAIVLHGLEGNAQRPYALGSAKIFNQSGYDAVCVNYRSCSGEPNKQYRSYHSGETGDLEFITHHIIEKYQYDTVILNGFSLGGNLALKYLGQHHPIPKEIKAAIAVSVPCHLYGSMLEIHKTKNYLYAKRFKKNLIEKLRQKQQSFPNKISKTDIKKIVTLKDFDDCYTSQAHGFKDALDYYEKSSSLPFLQAINVPTLIINAKNDSFLSDKCYPFQKVEKNQNLYLEVPEYGGHVGFYDKNNVYYTEKRAIEFLKELVPHSSPQTKKAL
ncbi:alpha/beta fold hydrolase [Galbibacter sp. EGI 63066]|uniref:YheT family hydrolase n=1 Tax=Galbibacter sp. EGI 63066 TaxID=2993559 RepID=UPI002248EF70|nr:alpha/beta fold hydrolase [Galbibacter sp. EGI 63066]MCX2680579.1 alpha/beta fold hydrolase [Galbibacter sp. EGI 63066]